MENHNRRSAAPSPESHQRADSSAPMFTDHFLRRVDLPASTPPAAQGHRTYDPNLPIDPSLHIDGRAAPSHADIFSVQAVHANGRLLGQWDGVVDLSYARQHERAGPRFTVREMRGGRGVEKGWVTRDVAECAIVCENGDEWDCWMTDEEGVLVVDQWAGGATRAVVGPGVGRGGVEIVLGGPEARAGSDAARPRYGVRVRCERHQALIGIYRGVVDLHVEWGVGELGERFLVDVRDARGEWSQSLKQIKGLEIAYLRSAEFALKLGRDEGKYTEGKGNEIMRLRGGAGHVMGLDGAGDEEDNQARERELQQRWNAKGKGKAVEESSSTSHQEYEYKRRVRRDGPWEIIDNPEPDYILGRTPAEDRNIDGTSSEEWAEDDSKTWSLVDDDEEVPLWALGHESDPFFSLDAALKSGHIVEVDGNLMAQELAMEMGLIPDKGPATLERGAGTRSARIPGAQQSSAGMATPNPRSAQPDAGTGGRPQGQYSRPSTQDASSPSNAAAAGKASEGAHDQQGKGTAELLDLVHDYIHNPSKSEAEDSARFTELQSVYQARIQAGAHGIQPPRLAHPGHIPPPKLALPPHGACYARHATGSHAVGRAPPVTAQRDRDALEARAISSASSARQASGRGTEKRVRFAASQDSRANETRVRDEGGLCAACRGLCEYCCVAKRHRREL